MNRGAKRKLKASRIRDSSNYQNIFAIAFKVLTLFPTLSPSLLPPSSSLRTTNLHFPFPSLSMSITLLFQNYQFIHNESFIKAPR
jgi:ABC-type transport system involved in cytochrome c biogenesis permease subunit